MAKTPAAKPEPAPEPQMPAVTGAMVGDPIVYVKLIGSPVFTACRSKEGRSRQIVIDGRPCEHVGEAPDGTWQYEQRAW